MSTKQIQQPRYTQFPNVIIDEWLKELSGSEAKIIMVMCRKIFGWGKKGDHISISQIMEFSGLSKRGVIDATKSLAEKGYIIPGNTTRKGKYYKFNLMGAKNAHANSTGANSAHINDDMGANSAPENGSNGANSAHTKEIERDLLKKGNEIAAYSFVTGLTPDIGRYDYIEKSVESIIGRHHFSQVEDFVEHMTAFYSAWCKTRSDNGHGKLYNPSNPKWLDWAISGYTPSTQAEVAHVNAQGGFNVG